MGLGRGAIESGMLRSSIGRDANRSVTGPAIMYSLPEPAPNATRGRRASEGRLRRPPPDRVRAPDTASPLPPRDKSVAPDKTCPYLVEIAQQEQHRGVLAR